MRLHVKQDLSRWPERTPSRNEVDGQVAVSGTPAAMSSEATDGELLASAFAPEERGHEASVNKITFRYTLAVTDRPLARDGQWDPATTQRDFGTAEHQPVKRFRPAGSRDLNHRRG